MGKALILLVTASIMGAGVILFNGVQQSTFKADSELGEHEARVLARQIALSGVSEARASVLGSPADFVEVAHLSGSAMGGQYETVITPIGSGQDKQFAVRVEGRVPVGRNGSMATHTIEVTYGIAPDSELIIENNGVPQFFSYALLMEGPLNISGNMNVRGRPGLNANAHTNSDIFVEGGNHVGGFGTYVTHAVSQPARRLWTTFAPSVNPDNQPTVHQTGRVNIVEFNASDFRDLATREFAGDLTLSGTHAFGPRSSPEIWYVGGNLEITGGHLEGYVIFLVEGDIVLSGNFTTGEAALNESTIGLYTSGNVRMAGNVEVAGQFLARHDLQFSGTSALHGSVTVGGTVVWDGTPTIYYREASPALTDPLWPEAIPAFDDWRAIAYREFAGRITGTSQSS